MVSDYFYCFYVNRQAKVNETRLILQQVSLTMIIFDKNEDDPWRKKWQPTLVFLPGTSYGQRSLVSYSP